MIFMNKNTILAAGLVAGLVGSAYAMDYNIDFSQEVDSETLLYHEMVNVASNIASDTYDQYPNQMAREKTFELRKRQVQKITLAFAKEYGEDELAKAFRMHNDTELAFNTINLRTLHQWLVGFEKVIEQGRKQSGPERDESKKMARRKLTYDTSNNSNNNNN